MSNMLDFPPRPLPPNLNSPPYVIFGINGTNITLALPPRIPLNMVFHFAPTLQKWLLPAPDPAFLPRSAMNHALCTPCVGIDILAPIDVTGLCWILTRMLQLSGAITRREAFSVSPDLATALAIHNAWLALELPRSGLQSLHMHMTAQLILGSPAVGLQDMRALWDAFPRNSGTVRAMGWNFMQACAEDGYEAREAHEIMEWLHSTTELWVFFKRLREAMPVMMDCYEDGEMQGSAAEEKDKAIGTGFQTVGQKAGRVIKAAVAAQACRQVGIMEKQITRKVSPQERNAREESDFESLRRRLRRIRSDDSLRSVDTTIWDPQTPEEDSEKAEHEAIFIDMNGSYNYTDSTISKELAASLEIIHLRREARLAKNRSSAHPPQQERALVKLEQDSAEC